MPKKCSDDEVLVTKTVKGEKSRVCKKTADIKKRDPYCPKGEHKYKEKCEKLPIKKGPRGRPKEYCTEGENLVRVTRTVNKVKSRKCVEKDTVKKRDPYCPKGEHKYKGKCETLPIKKGPRGRPKKEKEAEITLTPKQAIQVTENTINGSKSTVQLTEKQKKQATPTPVATRRSARLETKKVRFM